MSQCSVQSSGKTSHKELIWKVSWSERICPAEDCGECSDLKVHTLSKLLNPVRETCLHVCISFKLESTGD